MYDECTRCAEGMFSRLWHDHANAVLLSIRINSPEVWATLPPLDFVDVYECGSCGLLSIRDNRVGS